MNNWLVWQFFLKPIFQYWLLREELRKGVERVSERRFVRMAMSGYGFVDGWQSNIVSYLDLRRFLADSEVNGCILLRSQSRHDLPAIILGYGRRPKIAKNFVEAILRWQGSTDGGWRPVAYFEKSPLTSC